MSTNSTQSTESDNRIYQLQGLDRTSWEAFSDSFIGACGSASTMCHVPLICKAEDYYASAIATGDVMSEEDAMKEWNKQNNRACAKLATACSKVAGARAIVNKHMPGTTSIDTDGQTVTKIFGDGRGAWLELRKNCSGRNWHRHRRILSIEYVSDERKCDGGERNDITTSSACKKAVGDPRCDTGSYFQNAFP